MKKGEKFSVPISLYVHVPFCAGTKCDYCDFYSVPVAYNNGPEDPRIGRFIDMLLWDAGEQLDFFKPCYVPTLYVGGGTPSVLGCAGIKRLLLGLLNLIARYSPLPPEEVTIEANPESAGEAFLAAACEGGADRLSLGIQTFYGPSRMAVSRFGDEKLLHSILALAGEYFPGSFSADLITGLPLQTGQIAHDDIAALLYHKPSHVSYYALTIESGTPLAKRVANDEIAVPMGEVADNLWISGRDALLDAGYFQYEVSNFCRNGKESHHNLQYWLMQNWLGLGPSASGTVIDEGTGTAQRFTNASVLNLWLERGAGAAPPGSLEILDASTLMRETLLMGFRLAKGPDTQAFRRRFGKEIEESIPATIEKWRNKELFRSDVTALNEDGLLFLNRFLADAFGELEELGRRS